MSWKYQLLVVISMVFNLHFQTFKTHQHIVQNQENQPGMAKTKNYYKEEIKNQRKCEK